VIAAGFPRADLETVFASCELAGHFTIPYGIENYAIGHAPDIFVCRHPKEPWDMRVEAISLVWVDPSRDLLNLAIVQSIRCSPEGVDLHRAVADETESDRRALPARQISNYHYKMVRGCPFQAWKACTCRRRKFSMVWSKKNSR
jgi:hypothetical protein